VVHAQLLRWIESGQLEVGSKLPSEHELAESFGVSRSVVREALRGLGTMGLVCPRNGRGTFVTSTRPVHGGVALLGRASTDELDEVRSHLELPGATLAARRRTPAQLVALGDIVEAQSQCTDPEEWVRLDAAFHIVIAEATRNRVQVQLVENLRELLVEQSIAVARVPGRLPAATEEHRAILAAVGSGDEAGARAAMARHLERIRAESHRVVTGLRDDHAEETTDVGE
jgi:GntR family transcriptional regulator, transcriptional repressor for pyruvate dehydrogenase complex